MGLIQKSTGRLFQAAHQQALWLGDRRRTQALHDFRVAIRKLRCWLDLMDVPSQLRDRIRRLTKGTNAARDAEAQLAWLKKIHAHSLVSLWQQKVKQTREQARELIVSSFFDLEQELQKVIPSATQFRLETAIHKARRDLGKKLAQIHGLLNQAEIHHARIAAKRLRYLMEPEPHVELKTLQDILGDLHDLRILIKHLDPAKNSQVIQKLSKKEQERYEDFRTVKLLISATLGFLTNK